MELWYEICNIAESITFNSDCDSTIWSFNSSDIFSVQSLCCGELQRCAACPLPCGVGFEDPSQAWTTPASAVVLDENWEAVATSSDYVGV